MQQHEDRPSDDWADDRNDDQNSSRDDRDNEPASPAVPHQRRPGPEENWAPDTAHCIPRQPGPNDTDH